MISCPKCGSRTIIGPRYRINEAGGELLLYTCAPCGYQTTTPTRDAKPRMQTATESLGTMDSVGPFIWAPGCPDHLLKAAEAKQRLFVHVPHNEEDLAHPDID